MIRATVRNPVTVLAAGLAFCVTGLAQAADEAPARAWYGYSAKVSVSVLMNIEEAVIDAVEKDSPASRAGLAVGDRVTEIEGCAVPGCGAFKARGLLRKPAGEGVHLKLTHADGTPYMAELIGTVPPPGASPRKD